MSKHQKELRRERRKVDRARRWRVRNPQSAIRNGAAALAAAAAIAAGTSAYADPVRFDNPAGPGHFEWSDAQGVLSVLDDAASQPGVLNAVGTLNRYSYYYGSVLLAGGASTKQEILDVGGYFFALPHNAGDLIPSGAPFQTQTFAVGFYGSSYLPEGVQTYLGVRFDLGGGNQYGWIGVVKTGLELDAFAWGYETDPGVSIPAGAPEPGTLALLAMGAVGVLSRRRHA